MLNSNGNSDTDRFCFNSKKCEIALCVKRKTSLVTVQRVKIHEISQHSQKLAKNQVLLDNSNAVILRIEIWRI